MHQGNLNYVCSVTNVKNNIAVLTLLKLIHEYIKHSNAQVAAILYCTAISRSRLEIVWQPDIVLVVPTVNQLR